MREIVGDDAMPERRPTRPPYIRGGAPQAGSLLDEWTHRRCLMLAAEQRGRVAAAEAKKIEIPLKRKIFNVGARELRGSEAIVGRLRTQPEVAIDSDCRTGDRQPSVRLWLVGHGRGEKSIGRVPTTGQDQVVSGGEHRLETRLHAYRRGSAIVRWTHCENAIGR